MSLSYVAERKDPDVALPENLGAACRTLGMLTDADASLARGASRNSRKLAYSASPAELAEQIMLTQPERWTAFHRNEPRILIVDDNPRTAQRLAAGLTALYGKNVTYDCDPLNALQLIRQRKSEGIPFDLVVTDLYMPQLSGTQLLKELGDACPSVVINTGSMLAPVLADLKVQMDDYAASLTEQLLESHNTERRITGIPQAPILVQLKGQSWKRLVDKVDSALFLSRGEQERGKGVAAFLDYFQPQLVPVTFSAQTVHNLVEEVRNAVASISPIVKELSDLPEVQASSWWNFSAESVVASLAVLEKAHFSRILSENPGLTWQAVHDLVGEFKNISPNGLTGLCEARANELVEQWNNAYKSYETIVTAFANGMRAYVQDEVNIRNIVEIESSNNGITVVNLNGQDAGVEMLVSDPNRMLRDFLTSAISNFSQCVQRNQNSKILIRLVNESERFSESAEITRSLKPLGAGPYYQVTFVDESKGSFDLTFGSIFRTLPLLLQAGLAHFRVDTIPGGTSRFQLFVKVGAANVDLNQYRAEVMAAAATSDDSISLLGGIEIKVYRDRGLARNIICLGDLPQKIDLDAAAGTVLFPAGLVYTTSERTYVSTAVSHREAATLIAEYMALSIDTQLVAPSTNEILLAGVRISTSATKGIQIEPESQIEKSQRARDILIELGLLPARASISADAFKARKVIESKPEPLPVYVQEWFDGTKIINQLRQHFAGALNPAAQATVSAYDQITKGPSIIEPSFIIRSRVGLTLEQQRDFCHKLNPVMDVFELCSWGVEEYLGMVTIDGEAPRKSGLYLFDSSYRGRSEHSSRCNFTHLLKALISRGSVQRLGNDGMALIEGELLRKDTLIYGGGDHSLTDCKQQWGLALAIELTLQALQIPYDSCRGSFTDRSRIVRFDGQKIETLEDGSPLPINIEAFFDFD